MSIVNPAAVSINDLCIAALKECGAFGVGQTPLAEDINDAWARAQFMIQEWNRKRWAIYHLKTIMVTSNGNISYTVGPGQQFDTGAGMRPTRLENGCYVRQTNTGTIQNQVDYPLEILQSFEDYNRIRLKGLNSFPSFIFLDPGQPNGTLYVWPVPQASIYSIAILVKEVLPVQYLTLNSLVNLPYEYYNAIHLNLALRLRPKYGILSVPGDILPGLARDALNALRLGNSAISRLQMPKEISRPGLYNIFSDRFY